MKSPTATTKIFSRIQKIKGELKKENILILVCFAGLYKKSLSDLFTEISKRQDGLSSSKFRLSANCKLLTVSFNADRFPADNRGGYFFASSRKYPLKSRL